MTIMVGLACGRGVKSKVYSQSRGVCVLDKEASGAEKLAAGEIRRYLYLCTGELIPIISNTKGLTAATDLIVIGQKDRKHIKKHIANGELPKSVESLKAQEYVIKTVNIHGYRLVLIVGGDEIGTLYGAYRFAELLGVRFYLHGDVIPDTQTPWNLPKADEHGKPLFELRGIQPFHDFPEGPDWWNTNDYKAIIGQLPKLRMNFFGLHTYPEGKIGPEPTVWIGLKRDIGKDGKIRFSYPSSYHNTLRGTWGYAAKKTSEYSFGSAALFERDDFGPEVMSGMVPGPKTAEENNELFNRVGAMLKEAFTFAHKLGVKTCVGTETPLTIPKSVKKRLEELGKKPGDIQVVQELYEGMFERIKSAYPLDYYWFWTPEGWTWRGAKDEQVAATEKDMLAAVAAAEKVGAGFTLATCGWVLGPPKDRTAFDKLLPKEMPFSCINRNVGFDPVEVGFRHVHGRPKWAIPWLEDDNAMIIPQLWAGRIRRDAADALAYGCTGLIGIHWRTRVLGPSVLSLARASWDQRSRNPDVATPGMKRPRDLPVDDFYADWALSQFGSEVAKELAKLFVRLDGGPQAPNHQSLKANLPRHSSWNKGPGGIVTNSQPWKKVARQYKFVDEMAALRPSVHGAGNRERFDYWLNTFRYTRALAQVSCTIGQLDKVMKNITKEKDEVKKRETAHRKALPLRKQLVRQWGEMMKYLLTTVSNAGEMGTVMNIEQHNMGHLRLLNKHDKALEKILGMPLPMDTKPGREYQGQARLIVPTVRTSLTVGEELKLKVILLGIKPKSAALYWRPLGVGEYKKIPLEHVSRGVYKVLIPAKEIEGDFEYHVKISGDDEKILYYPATAPRINQTVVIMK